MIMRTSIGRIALMGLAVVSLVGACSSGSKSTFPTDKYIQVGDSPNSQAILEFKADGTYEFVGFDHGTYEVSGNVFTYETSSYCKGISPDAEKASYTWTWNGTILHFAPKGIDKCTDRARASAIDWKKAGT